MIPVVGIDPGGRWCGVCVRLRDEVLYRIVVERDGDDWPGYRTWLNDEAEVAFMWAHRHCPAGAVPLLAVETLTHPSPHMRVTNVQALMDTARVLGWLDVLFPADDPSYVRVDIPPNKHGSSPLVAYPDVLVGPKERGVYGSGILRHARSAYDLCGAAGKYVRIGNQARGG